MSKYTCAECGGTFVMGRPDDEAIAEMMSVSGFIPEEHRAIVCDDCYVEIMVRQDILHAAHVIARKAKEAKP